ncbi:lactococcin 972 family bacteriocin [Listeria seeligeri]|uniref:Lactococcin 972 family bacteriocin n=1 Tax=Listeria seeligeri TaxID=1640 RepID=A0A7X0X0W7_LISSE|nr:lactococcin 972 family bacteriocin [Listeria seeligeri]MBC1485603.1 lactococcin 972 family bacteriocin [Listeria seeligeri]MBC2247637.1 lactococcin 972 family bacteriocin [Listeria seeligeri]MBF2402479.1 lactococcin 972 family bacteriocin [Listeria seeligeri]MBF2545949.1 lactococcin 972 family bacteriocin [Listeria seeligeri]MBF2631067.1 lactococcin 972 family bacteriocin [Listeria seeligeri]
MKKKVCVLGITLFTVLAPVGALAADSTTKEVQGETNLDNLISKNTEGEKVIFSESKEASTNSRPLLKASAGGGTFTVKWGGDRHWSNYNHSKKTHRSSASNNRATERSEWKSKGKLASVWIKSSLSGNKANWATK